MRDVTPTCRHQAAAAAGDAAARAKDIGGQGDKEVVWPRSRANKHRRKRQSDRLALKRQLMIRLGTFPVTFSPPT